MAGRQPRGLFMRIVKNFKDSFKVLQDSSFDGRGGKLIGQDPQGNKYYEVPADPSRGRRQARRWFESPVTGSKDVVGKDVYGGFDAEKPAEWEAWLRHRREEPPTVEQVMHSLALADMKKRNAAKLEEKRIDELKALGRYTGPPQLQDHEKPAFPTYDDLESFPGEKESDMRRRHMEGFKNPYFDEKTGKAKPERD